MSTSQFDYWCISQYSSTLFRTPVCLFLCVQRETTSHPGETVGGEKKKTKIGFSLHSSSSANTDIVKQSAKHFALRGWTSGGTIIMTHFSLSLLDSSVTRGAPGNAQSSIFVQWHPCNCHTTLSVPKGTLGNGEGYSDPHRVAQAPSD